MALMRLGRILTAEDGPDWMVSHATYATPVVLNDGAVRIFFVSRDAENRGSVGWVEVDPENPKRLLNICRHPCITPGEMGAFDDRGLSIGCILRVRSELWLYYMGWNRAGDVPFRNAIGLAISRDGRGDAFQRISEGPILDRSRFDPFTISYPYVVGPRCGAPWLMYYGSSQAGGRIEEKMSHHLTMATSANGIDWQPTGRVEIGLQTGEYGLSRPWIYTKDDREFMLFSIRREQYSIGLATRTPGQPWRRLSDNLLGPSSEAWDNEASCYASILDHLGRTYLLYSGNNYGRSGFGVASASFTEFM